MKKEREQISRTADRVREDLMLSLHELDRRKDEVLSVNAQFQKHKTLVYGIAAGAGVLVAGSITWSLLAARNERKHLASSRREAVLRAWRHPERLASRAKDKPAGAQLLTQLGIAVAVAFATQLAKRTATEVLPTTSAIAQR